VCQAQRVENTCRGSYTHASFAGLQSISAVWAPAPATGPQLVDSAHPCAAQAGADGLVSAATEICISSAVHLQLLLSCAEVQSCLWVQLPGEPVDMPAALAAYQGVLGAGGSSAGPRLALVTVNTQQVPGHPATHAGTSTAMLQGDSTACLSFP
jgi:hypothetical protein